ncbi:MAG: hypothetical protein ACREC9_13590 [Methylocella sp.]
MRPAPETIALGEKNWLVRPLTLRQVQEIEPISQAISRGECGHIEGIVKMLAAALRRDHHGDIEGLLDIEAPIGEVRAAMAAVMRLSGLVEAKEGGLGEALAAPVAAVPGAPSMAG